MNDFNWSVEARDTIGVFYDAEIMIYVEGTSDIRFWECVISEFTDKEIMVSHVGDKPTLLKYFRERESNSDYLIAMDSDYDQMLKKLDNANVLLTYGYSIENTIIVPEIMRELIISFTKVQKNSIEIKKLKSWLDEFENRIECLLAADLQDKLNATKQQNIIPDNASRFFEKNALMPDSDKINNYVIERGFELNTLSCRDVLCSWRVIDMIKGHFLSSAVQRFITNHIKISISNESFDAFCISNFEKYFNNNHTHYQYYKDMVNNHLNK